MADVCAHLEKLEDSRRKPVAPSGHGCKECLEAGGDWVHLRLCMSCGHVGCCDDSPSKHATKHFHKTNHPVIKSFEPGEDWAFCYPDDVMIDGVRSLAGEAASSHYAAPHARHP